MAFQLATPKRLLTMYSNRLETAVSRFKSEKIESLSVAAADGENRFTFIKESTQRLEEAIGALEEASGKIREVLQEYAETLSTLENPPEKETKDFDEYTSKAEKSLVTAFDYIVLLQARLRAFKSLNGESARTTLTSVLQVPSTVRKVELPTIPIPLFKGNIWEWDNFWELFNANVHSQDMPALFKFNYLLNALKGEALELVQKFQVTAENYPNAVEFLKNKYGNSEELVFRLIDKLENCSLRSSAIRDQRALFEQIQVIVDQLKRKNEDVNSQWLLKRILGKFPEYIQRKVLMKKQAENCDFTMGSLLRYLEEIISSEEIISVYVGRPSSPRFQERNENKQKPIHKFHNTCMYCGKSHKSGECDKYKSPQERSQYLRERKLCLICASPHHATTLCKKPPCFKCKKPHHTSCCFQFEKRQEAGIGVKKDGSQNSRGSARAKQDQKVAKATIKVNNVSQEDASEEETSILELHSEQCSVQTHNTFLPTGQATVLDPSTNFMRKITILLDTGAQVSFIDATLAEELQLPTLAQVRLKVRTFGTKEVQEKVCRRVLLSIWDSEGKPLTLNLLTCDVLTSSFAAPPIRDDDIKFIQALDLPTLHLNQKSIIKPLILLGCDQLWPLIHNDQPHVELPSGLHLLSTKLGHLLTGQLQESQQHKEDDNYWSMDEHQINSLTQPFEESQENEQWEKYWELEKAGSEEFLSSEKQIQAQEDQQVWETFNQTIEKRSDGYYVRLPWKDVTASLPSNHAIAFHRLVSLWNSLQQDTDLLKRYNEIFEEQLDLNILEDVQENATPSGPRVHYIPHQAVLTPQKKTTKIRIVYDASAHHKGSPSLNDVLHRGPVILPPLYGILLRFRIGRIGLISDVEKAFLQVRLHEADRDATRCLWLKNYTLPPSPENIRVLRFTRVTFGINSSPFLLAGTTHFHLNQYDRDVKLAASIKENLYVDNLVLSMDTFEEALDCYSKTKEIFNDLKMNIREFVSNSSELRELMAEKDKSVDICPKVLGISWSSMTDTLEIMCNPRETEKVTKRSVASALASVYDPLGWLVPLMHRSKIFLRSLWKDQYDWDTVLPRTLENEWRQICQDIQGFKVTVPRYLAEKHSDAVLVTFADASTEAIASCVYLRSPNSCHILMAKSKLPSLKAKATIPKMELNAMTLAMRLTNSVLSQMRSVLHIQQVYILTDSEIVLSWIKSRPLQKVSVMIFNRLNEIDKIMSHLEKLGVQICFGHVPSQHNAADCATRGLTQHELQDSLWWHGPSMLREPLENWSNICKFVEPSQHLEEGHDAPPVPNSDLSVNEGSVMTIVQTDHDLFHKLEGQTLTRMKRIVAYVLRFIRNLVHRTNKSRVHPIQVSPALCYASERGASVSGSEIRTAMKTLVKTHQQSITPRVSQSMHHLNIQPDGEGLLRCYGRLGCSELSLEAQNPLFVLQNSWLAEAIIKDCHNKGHPGVSHTMSLVRQQFWIPKLRAQVTKIIRKCVACQKLNNLPYKYPLQGNLPTQRVQRSRPFSHVGLDYFGPLAIIHPDGSEGKSYGCIITCMATRLIHLDAVTDLSTIAFLRMLRRFFARRGTPISITSDNSPTFILGENILSDCLQAAKNDPQVEQLVADREIEWRYITPFAPWQGGFYERLIKSVKHSLYKSVGKARLLHDDLTTILVEIEGLLNTRPLLYEESDLVGEQGLRPIDFLQNKFEVPFPLDHIDEEIEDPSYACGEERTLIKTKKQAIEALKSSCKYTDKFWQTWRTHYLTSLREQHQLEVGSQKGSRYSPKKDAIVLISDPIHPRHCWKIGRIQDLKTHNGVTREASVMLPSHRVIRRPVNQLIPLELEDNRLEDKEKIPLNSRNQANSDLVHEEVGKREQPYNLRPRKQINYGLHPIHLARQVSIVSLVLTICSLVGFTSSTSTEQPHSIRCIPGGVELRTNTNMPYQICAEENCKTYDRPNVTEVVKFPPQVILHDYEVQWKFAKDPIGTIETTCPAAPFCDHLDCNFCSTVIFNPECWPVGAIMASALLIYFIITGCYVFLYVPLIIGSPVRIVAGFAFNGICRTIAAVLRRLSNLGQRRRRRKPTDLVQLLAVAILIVCQYKCGESCQQVDIFSHTSTVCQNTDQENTCKVHLSDVLKLNTFKKEACFKLQKGNTTIHEFRAEWKSLSLLCEAEVTSFTRDAKYQVISRKRCSLMGSCTGEKCAAVTDTSLIEELKEGNKYPGVTMCVESCGGFGCDCVSLGSGCLFYRIYATPTSPDVYEIFRCNRWRETAKVKFTHTDIRQRTTQSYTAFMIPNVPILWKSFTLTLSLVKFAPTPLLNTPFITNGKSTAMWNSQMTPLLECQNKSQAEKFDCIMTNKCVCYPAETQANCICNDLDISVWINDLRHRLPLVYPSVIFKRDREGQVFATIPSMTTAEIIMTMQGNLKTDVLVDETTCSVPNVILTGCYKCAKGAKANVSCRSSRPTQAEITCESISFTVECSKEEKTSTVRLSFDSARIHQKCRVSCGRSVTTFEIAGLLKYSHTASGMAHKWLRGETSSEYAFHWPDFSHIFNVFLLWYKTLLGVCIALLILLVLTYILISAYGIRLTSWALKIVFHILTVPLRLFFLAVKYLFRQKIHTGHEKRW